MTITGTLARREAQGKAELIKDESGQERVIIWWDEGVIPVWGSLLNNGDTFRFVEADSRDAALYWLEAMRQDETLGRGDDSSSQPASSVVPIWTGRRRP